MNSSITRWEKKTLEQFSVPADLIYAEKFEFENPTIMEDKQCS